MSSYISIMAQKACATTLSRTNVVVLQRQRACDLHMSSTERINWAIREWFGRFK